MSEILTTKEFVEKYELMAKKALGQNFLLDANITDKIVRLSLENQGLDDLSQESVVEVGPGPGGLTLAVLRKNPKKFSVIEMDERCLNILRSTLIVRAGQFIPQIPQRIQSSMLISTCPRLLSGYTAGSAG